MARPAKTYALTRAPNNVHAWNHIPPSSHPAHCQLYSCAVEVLASRLLNRPDAMMNFDKPFYHAELASEVEPNSRASRNVRLAILRSILSSALMRSWILVDLLEQHI